MCLIYSQYASNVGLKHLVKLIMVWEQFKAHSLAKPCQKLFNFNSKLKEAKNRKRKWKLRL